jgi:hypothetical protein
LVLNPVKKKIHALHILSKPNVSSRSQAGPRGGAGSLMKSPCFEVILLGTEKAIEEFAGETQVAGGKFVRHW